MRFVFLHELAHLRCHDVLAEWLIAVLTTVHWFNPAVWIAAYFYRADREVWRDAMVLRAVGREHRAGYGSTLLHLLQTAGGREAGGRLAVGMLGEKHHLKERIRMIAELRKRPGRLAAVALGVVCVVIAALVLTNPRRVERSSLATTPASKPQSVASEDTVVQAQLDRRIPEIKFNGQRLEDVVDILRDVSRARIFVNWRALDAAGIDKDWPISARMRDVRFSKALDVVLSDAGGGRVKLGYATDGGVITISTADDLPKHLSTVVYDIHDLAVPVRDYDSDPERPLRSRRGATRPVEAPWTQPQITAALIKLVRETIDPVSWSRRNDPATIQERDGQFVIRQDAQNHRDIARLLDQLRETRTFQISTVIRFVVFNSLELPKDDPAFAPIMSMDNPPPEPSDKVKRSPTFLTADQTAALLKFVSDQRGAVGVRAAPTLKTVNGQRAFIKVATSRAYVGDLKVVRDAGGKFKSYEPMVESADSGLTVDLQGTVSADRLFVTLSIRPLLTKLLKLHTIPFDKVPADHPAGMAKPTVQEPEMLTTEAETTWSVPDGQTLVMSLGSDFGLLAAEDYVPKAGDQIYMLVTPHLTRTPGARR
jgi:hypothetical protein